MFRFLSPNRRRVPPPRATFKPDLQQLEKRTPPSSSQSIFQGTQTQLIQDTISAAFTLGLDYSKQLNDQLVLQINQAILKTPLAGTLGVTNETLVSDQVRIGIDQLNVGFDLHNFFFDLNVLVGNGTLQPPTPPPAPAPTNDPDNDGDADMY